MLASKTVTDPRITEEIEAMNFHDRCQARLNHKTCLFLSQHGYKPEKQIKLRQGKSIPAIRNMVHLPAEWDRFYLDRPLTWWDEYLPESHFDIWSEHRFFSPEPHFASDGWWKVKGGNNESKPRIQP